MKKTTRNILIMLAVLVVLGGAAAALLLTQPEEQEESSSSASSSVTEKVMEKSTRDVSVIKVENAEGSYQLVPIEEPETETSASSGTDSSSSGSEKDAAFTVKGLEDYDVNTVDSSSAARSVLDVNASKNLGEVTNLEDFGLSGNGAAKITIEYKAGGSDTLVIGNDAGGSVGKYVLKDGTAYVVSGLNEKLLGKGLAFLKTDLYTVADLMEETTDSEGSTSQTKAADILYSMKLSGTNFEKPIEITHDTTKMSGYLVTSPVKAEAGTDRFSTLVTTLKTLSADSVAAVGVTEEKLGDYGLAEPFAQIDFDLNGEKHTLKVSETDADGKRYLMADSSDVVYLIAADKVAGWAEAKLMDLRMSYICLPNIMEVSKLKLTLNGAASEYDVTRTKNEEKSTESNITYDLSIQSGAGKEISYDDTYQPFYKQLIAIAVLNTEEVEYSGEPVFRVEYSYFNGNAASVVEFYAIEGQDRYAAVLDGVYSGVVRKASVDNVTALLDKLGNNEAISS